MGQKTHPTGFRLGIVKDWKSRWYAERDFPRLLKEDETIRRYLHRRLSHAAISRVDIERKPSKIVVTLHTARIRFAATAKERTQGERKGERTSGERSSSGTTPSPLSRGCPPSAGYRYGRSHATDA